MNYIAPSLAVQPEEHIGFHPLQDRIRDRELPRAWKAVLTALNRLRSGTKLHTRDFPVTVDKIMQEASYKRSHTLASLRELEEAGLIRRIRNKVRYPDGTIRNAPTTYILTLPGEDGTPQPIPRDTRTQIRKPSRSYDAAPVEPVAAPPTTVRSPEQHKTAPAPPKPIKASVEPAQHPEMTTKPESADGVPEWVVEMGDLLVAEARAHLEPHVNGKQHRAVMVAWQGITSHRYTLGQAAWDACEEHLLQGDVPIACVSEWVRKAVIGNPCVSPVQAAARLRNFFYAKGKAIAGMRKELKW